MLGASVKQKDLALILVRSVKTILYVMSSAMPITAELCSESKCWNTSFGISPFILFIPLHSKFMNESVTKTFNFKERLCNIKLRDIDTLLEKSTCPLIGVQYEPKTSEM